MAACFNYVCHFIAQCLIIKKVRGITQHTCCEPRWPLSGNGTNQPNQTTSNQPTNQPTSHEPPFTLRSPPRASLRIAAPDLRIRANTILAVPYTPDIRSFPICVYIYLPRHSRESSRIFFRANVKRRKKDRKEGMDGREGKRRRRKSEGKGCRKGRRN